MADVIDVRAAMHAPFRPFFLAAALDAVLGASPWLPLMGRWGTSSAGDWHRDALLFGTVPAMLAGFLLTALPRWSGAPGPSKGAVVWLFALWLSGRAAHVLVSPAAGLATSALFVAVLIARVAPPVLASPERRNRKVLLLLALYGASAMLAAASWQTGIALRMTIAAIVGLLMVIGGRVTPALAASHAAHAGVDLGAASPSLLLERAAAAAAAVALAAWILAPDAPLTGLAAGTAALGQAQRAVRWRGWRSRSPTVIALQIGYGWIVVGFALLAVHALAPAGLAAAAAIHAWTIGAFGTMGLAVMASMIRRHCGRAFARSALLAAAFVTVTASCLSRLALEFLPAHAGLWTTAGAAAWIAGFVLFLAAFHRPLLVRA